MKKLLVVVDMQNDFVTGSLGFSKSLNIVPKVIEHIKEFELSGNDIVFTRDYHEEDYLSSTEGKHLPIKHCVSNTWGIEIIDDLKPFIQNKKVFDKNGFVSLDLLNFVRDNRYDDVYLVGLITDICVLGNAVALKGAVGHNGKVTVYKDGVETANEEMSKIAFKAMENIHIEIE